MRCFSFEPEVELIYAPSIDRLKSLNKQGRPDRCPDPTCILLFVLINFLLSAFRNRTYFYRPDQYVTSLLI